MSGETRITRPRSDRWNAEKSELMALDFCPRLTSLDPVFHSARRFHGTYPLDAASEAAAAGDDGAGHQCRNQSEDRSSVRYGTGKAGTYLGGPILPGDPQTYNRGRHRRQPPPHQYHLYPAGHERRASPGPDSRVRTGRDHRPSGPDRLRLLRVPVAELGVSGDRYRPYRPEAETGRGGDRAAHPCVTVLLPVRWIGS